MANTMSIGPNNDQDYSLCKCILDSVILNGGNLPCKGTRLTVCGNEIPSYCNCPSNHSGIYKEGELDSEIASESPENILRDGAYVVCDIPHCDEPNTYLPISQQQYSIVHRVSEAMRILFCPSQVMHIDLNQRFGGRRCDCEKRCVGNSGGRVAYGGNKQPSQVTIFFPKAEMVNHNIVEDYANSRMQRKNVSPEGHQSYRNESDTHPESKGWPVSYGREENHCHCGCPPSVLLVCDRNVGKTNKSSNKRARDTGSSYSSRDSSGSDSRRSRKAKAHKLKQGRRRSKHVSSSDKNRESEMYTKMRKEKPRRKNHPCNCCCTDERNQPHFRGNNNTFTNGGNQGNSQYSPGMDKNETWSSPQLIQRERCECLYRPCRNVDRATDAVNYRSHVSEEGAHCPSVSGEKDICRSNCCKCYNKTRTISNSSGILKPAADIQTGYEGFGSPSIQDTNNATQPTVVRSETPNNTPDLHETSHENQSGDAVITSARRRSSGILVPILGSRTEHSGVGRPSLEYTSHFAQREFGALDTPNNISDLHETHHEEQQASRVFNSVGTNTSGIFALFTVNKRPNEDLDSPMVQTTNNPKEFGEKYFVCDLKHLRTKSKEFSTESDNSVRKDNNNMNKNEQVHVNDVSIGNIFLVSVTNGEKESCKDQKQCLHLDNLKWNKIFPNTETPDEIPDETRRNVSRIARSSGSETGGKHTLSKEDQRDLLEKSSQEFLTRIDRDSDIIYEHASSSRTSICESDDIHLVYSNFPTPRHTIGEQDRQEMHESNYKSYGDERYRRGVPGINFKNILHSNEASPKISSTDITGKGKRNKNKHSNYPTKVIKNKMIDRNSGSASRIKRSLIFICEDIVSYLRSKFGTRSSTLSSYKEIPQDTIEGLEVGTTNNQFQEHRPEYSKKMGKFIRKCRNPKPTEDHENEISESHGITSSKDKGQRKHPQTWHRGNYDKSDTYSNKYLNESGRTETSKETPLDEDKLEVPIFNFYTKSHHTRAECPEIVEILVEGKRLSIDVDKLLSDRQDECNTSSNNNKNYKVRGEKHALIDQDAKKQMFTIQYRTSTIEREDDGENYNFYIRANNNSTAKGLEENVPPNDTLIKKEDVYCNASSESVTQRRLHKREIGECSMKDRRSTRNVEKGVSPRNGSPLIRKRRGSEARYNSKPDEAEKSSYMKNNNFFDNTVHHTNYHVFHDMFLLSILDKCRECHNGIDDTSFGASELAQEDRSGARVIKSNGSEEWPSYEKKETKVLADSLIYKGSPHRTRFEGIARPCSGANLATVRDELQGRHSGAEEIIEIDDGCCSFVEMNSKMQMGHGVEESHFIPESKRDTKRKVYSRGRDTSNTQTIDYYNAGSSYSSTQVAESHMHDENEPKTSSSGIEILKGPSTVPFIIKSDRKYSSRDSCGKNTLFKFRGSRASRNERVSTNCRYSVDPPDIMVRGKESSFRVPYRKKHTSPHNFISRKVKQGTTKRGIQSSNNNLKSYGSKDGIAGRRSLMRHAGHTERLGHVFPNRRTPEYATKHGLPHTGKKRTITNQESRSKGQCKVQTENSTVNRLVGSEEHHEKHSRGREYNEEDTTDGISNEKSRVEENYWRLQKLLHVMDKLEKLAPTKDPR